MRTRNGEHCLLLDRLHHILELLELLSRLLDLLPALDDLLRLCLLALLPLDCLLCLLLLGSGEWIVLGVLGLLLLALPLLVLSLLLLLLLLLRSLDGSSLLLGLLDALLDDRVDGYLVVGAVDALNVDGAGLILALDAELLHVGHGGVNARLGGGQHLVEGELRRAPRAHHPRPGRRLGGLGGRVGVGLGLLATARGLGSGSGLAGCSVLARSHFEVVLIFFMSSIAEHDGRFPLTVRV